MGLLIQSRYLLLTPPKVGSRWQRVACEKLELEHVKLGVEHINGHGDLSYFGSNYDAIACFVREPVSWLTSYWHFRHHRKEANPEFALDRLCLVRSGDNFDKFVELYLLECPGYVSRMFRAYTHLGTKKIDFIGKQEHLIDHFSNLLSSWNIPHCTENLTRIGVVNGAKVPKAQMSSELAGAVRQAEAWAYDQYGYSV